MKNYTIFILLLAIISLNAKSQGFIIENTPDPMHIKRAYHNLATLDDGRVLTVGGHTSGFQLTSTAEIFDPQTGEWTLFDVPHAHDMAAFLRLQDGRFMFFGGCSSQSGVGRTNTTTIFDPSDDSFTSGPQMARARTNLNAITLSDGRILILGNWYDTGDAEIYDPVAGTFELVGIPVEQRSHTLMFPTADGGAYILSGVNTGGNVQYYNVVEFDGTSESFSTVSETIFEGESNWYTSWLSSHQAAEQFRLSDGRYVFLASKQISFSVYEYAIGLFDPVNKTIEKLETLSPLPNYEGVSSYAFEGNPMVDSENDLIYLFSSGQIDGVPQTRLITVSAQTGAISIPEEGHSFGYIFGTAPKTWLNGSILAAGGSVAGDNFVLTDEVNILTPSSTVNTSEVGINEIRIYPNPVKQGDVFTLETRTHFTSSAKIFNTSGQMVREVLINASDQLFISTQDLKQGLYFVQLLNKDGMISKKIVVQ